MEKPLLVLKPSIINAIIPVSFKYLFRSFFFTLALYSTLILIKIFGFIEISARQLFRRSLAVLFIIWIVSLLIKMILLNSTKYYFFNSHILSEFKLIIIKRHSAPYSQIVEIKTNISLWDRLCKAGDIVLHTAEDKNPNLVLSYIKNPQKIEEAIYNLVYSKKIPPSKR